MRATAHSLTLPFFPAAPLAAQELARPSCRAGGTLPAAPVYDPRFTLTPEQLAGYDLIIIALSGGKDSAAAFLHLLELGVPLEKLELAHHEVDGREGSTLMDWPCTPAYVRAFAAAFGVPLFFSWREGGFEREMLRQGTATAPVLFETPDGAIGRVGGEGDPGTRLKFPMPVANLEQRWCSGKLKIDVLDAALRNQDRVLNRRVLVVTGERAEESAARAGYALFQPHRADLRAGRKRRRHIDHWRPIHAWTERQVWEILERHRLNPHPAYRLGFGRCSCAACIFGSKHQWATLRAIAPAKFARIADYERRFGVTIHNKRLTVIQLAEQGTPHAGMREEDIRAALSTSWNEPIILPPGAAWALPAGAYGENCGPS
jgi:3'-phosphoadenosine 5'-phosphosulfate sulfotransferase (PAPS reductase)/FAD synthetase